MKSSKIIHITHISAFTDFFVATYFGHNFIILFNYSKIGLDDVLPMTRVVVAVAFVVAFIICRALLWPFITYYFCKDVFAALAADSKEAKAHKKWLWTFVITLTGLSVLQVIWLGQIILLTREEILKLMDA